MNTTECALVTQTPPLTELPDRRLATVALGFMNTDVAELQPLTSPLLDDIFFYILSFRGEVDLTISQAVYDHFLYKKAVEKVTSRKYRHYKLTGQYCIRQRKKSVVDAFFSHDEIQAGYVNYEGKFKGGRRTDRAFANCLRWGLRGKQTPSISDYRETIQTRIAVLTCTVRLNTQQLTFLAQEVLEEEFNTCLSTEGDFGDAYKECCLVACGVPMRYAILATKEETRTVFHTAFQKQDLDPTTLVVHAKDALLRADTCGIALGFVLLWFAGQATTEETVLLRSQFT